MASEYIYACLPDALTSDCLSRPYFFGPACRQGRVPLRLHFHVWTLYAAAGHSELWRLFLGYRFSFSPCAVSATVFRRGDV